MYVMGHLQVPSRDPHPLAENVLKVSFQGLTQPILELGCLHGSIISSLNGLSLSNARFFPTGGDMVTY